AEESRQKVFPILDKIAAAFGNARSKTDRRYRATIAPCSGVVNAHMKKTSARKNTTCQEYSISSTKRSWACGTRQSSAKPTAGAQTGTGISQGIRAKTTTSLQERGMQPRTTAQRARA